jgi:hypothetical protein
MALVNPCRPLPVRNSNQKHTDLGIQGFTEISTRFRETRSHARTFDELWLKNALEGVAQAYKWLALRLASALTKSIN